MIDVSKLKKSKRLGEPPSAGNIKDNITQPEVINLEVDGRSLKKTGRTHQLATRVTPEFYDKVRSIAARDRLKIVEVLERAIEYYEKSSS
jgi:predicted DNA-binding ribbon-helix-helix protein